MWFLHSYEDDVTSRSNWHPTMWVSGWPLFLSFCLPFWSWCVLKHFCCCCCLFVCVCVIYLMCYCVYVLVRVWKWIWRCATQSMCEDQSTICGYQSLPFCLLWDSLLAEVPSKQSLGGCPASAPHIPREDNVYITASGFWVCSISTQVLMPMQHVPLPWDLSSAHITSSLYFIGRRCGLSSPSS